MATLSRLKSRFLALALLVVLVAGSYGVIVQPVRDKFERYRDSIVQYEELIGRYRNIGGSLPALQAQLAELRGVDASKDVYLQGTSDALVAAELQNHVKSVVKASGGELRSTQILPVREENGFRRVAVRVQMTVDTNALRETFYALEASKPYIFIDNTDVRRKKIRKRRKQTEEKVTLNVRFDVYGYTDL